MTHPRTPFTSRNAWHFAVASAYPRHTTSIRVLCEARITDGAVVAEWDAATNTGWMRSIVVPQAVPATDGHAGYLGEAKFKPGDRVKTIDGKTTVVIRVWDTSVLTDAGDYHATKLTKLP